MDPIEMQEDACKAAARARDKGARLIKQGTLLLDVANAVEEKIKDFGALPAFPVNIAINEIAAHYTPKKNDTLRFSNGDVVKLDVGAHVNGYIGDTAMTVEVGTSRWSSLLKASEEALEKGIEMVSAGISVADIGRTIEQTINARGYNPIENLTGHGLKQYNLHSDPSVPNIGGGTDVLLEEGMTIAIEPFATTGGGYVEGTKGGNIYKLIRDRPPKSKNLLSMYSSIVEEHSRLPFAGRWVNGEEKDLVKLSRFGCISEYHILVEGTGGIVSQKEHSLLVTSNGCEVLTR